jgi:pyruvate carboxylase
MKMEAAITAPKPGTVARVAVSATAQVEGGDLLAVISSGLGVPPLAGEGEAT